MIGKIRTILDLCRKDIFIDGRQAFKVGERSKQWRLMVEDGRLPSLIVSSAHPTAATSQINDPRRYMGGMAPRDLQIKELSVVRSMGSFGCLIRAIGSILVKVPGKMP